MSKRKKVLKIIPKSKPKTRTVYVSAVLPVIKGKGDMDYLCGKCNEILVESINEGEVRNIIIRCPICRFYNNIP
ncbi:MAG: hypothetical protein JSV20_03440, partial [Candidatus Bathyarchaeota archaeon]